MKTKNKKICYNEIETGWQFSATFFISFLNYFQMKAVLTIEISFYFFVEKKYYFQVEKLL